jgi:hypothetical protein
MTTPTTTRIRCVISDPAICFFPRPEVTIAEIAATRGQGTLWQITA